MGRTPTSANAAAGPSTDPVPTAHVSPVTDESSPTTGGPGGDSQAIAPYNYPSNPALQHTAIPPMSPKSAAMTAAAYNLDPAILQTTIGSLLNSPAAAQMFLNSLNASVQGQALQSGPQDQLGSQSFASGSSSGSNALAGQYVNDKGEVVSDPTLALFTPLHHNNDGLVNHTDQLIKSYQDAAGMEQDVQGLQASINDLVRSMGLQLPEGPDGNVDLSSFDLQAPPNAANPAQPSAQPATADPAAGLGELDLPEGFDVDDFLASFNGQDGTEADDGSDKGVAGGNAASDVKPVTSS